MKSMKYFYKMWKGINELSESLLLGILFFILLNLTLQLELAMFLILTIVKSQFVKTDQKTE